MSVRLSVRIIAAILLGVIVFGIAHAADARVVIQAPAAQGSGAPAQAALGTRDAGLERRTSEIASELRCPVCQGVSVEDSPTELARQMRAVVRDQLAAGRTPDEVRAYFVDKYGEWILLRPKASGFNLVVYVLPWLALLGGFAVIVFAVRRWSRPLPAEAPEPAQPAGSTLES